MSNIMTHQITDSFFMQKFLAENEEVDIRMAGGGHYTVIEFINEVRDKEGRVVSVTPIPFITFKLKNGKTVTLNMLCIQSIEGA